MEFNKQGIVAFLGGALVSAFLAVASPAQAVQEILEPRDHTIATTGPGTNAVIFYYASGIREAEKMLAVLKEKGFEQSPNTYLVPLNSEEMDHQARRDLWPPSLVMLEYWRNGQWQKAIVTLPDVNNMGVLREMLDFEPVGTNLQEMSR